MSVSNSLTNTQGWLATLIILPSKSLRTHAPSLNFWRHYEYSFRIKSISCIDWANDKHDICLQDITTNKREFSVIKHKPKNIDTWANNLKKRFGGPIAVAVELSKGSIVYALLKYDFIVIIPVNPTTLAKYRTAFKPSRVKDDPTDAELTLELMLRYPDKFKPLKPQSINMRKLTYLLEQRRKLVDEK